MENNTSVPFGFVLLSREEFINRLQKLGKRTIYVLWLSINRIKDPEIAKRLNITKYTVRYHVRKAAIELGANDPNVERNSDQRSDLMFLCMVYYSDIENYVKEINF